MDSLAPPGAIYFYDAQKYVTPMGFKFPFNIFLILGLLRSRRILKCETTSKRCVHSVACFSRNRRWTSRSDSYRIIRLFKMMWAISKPGIRFNGHSNLRPHATQTCAPLRCIGVKLIFILLIQICHINSVGTLIIATMQLDDLQVAAESHRQWLVRGMALLSNLMLQNNIYSCW